MCIKRREWGRGMYRLWSVMIVLVLMRCTSSVSRVLKEHPIPFCEEDCHALCYFEKSADCRVCIDAMGLSEKGKAHELVANGDITFGGKYLINPSGGLISKGHPIGATGLAQASELVSPLPLTLLLLSLSEANPISGLAPTRLGN